MKKAVHFITTTFIDVLSRPQFKHKSASSNFSLFSMCHLLSRLKSMNETCTVNFSIKSYVTPEMLKL